MKSELLSSISERDRKNFELESDVDLLKKKMTPIRQHRWKLPSNRTKFDQTTSQLFPSWKQNIYYPSTNNYPSPNNYEFYYPANNSNENKRSIIVKFCLRSTKTDILAAARKKKAPYFFANEGLTPTQRTFGYVPTPKSQTWNFCTGFWISHVSHFLKIGHIEYAFQMKFSPLCTVINLNF